MKMQKESKKILVSPSIIAFDFCSLKREVRRIEESDSDSIHLDIMDGNFVPNITIGPFIVETIRKLTELPLIGHLMINNPEKYLDDFARAGCDSLIFHIEATKNPLKLINKIKAIHKNPGIAINPETSIARINPFLNEVTNILIMTVHPGFCGQEFMENQLLKIKKLRERYEGDIIVDGGVNDKTARLVIGAGANVLVAGNYLSKSDSLTTSARLKDRVKLLKTLI